MADVSLKELVESGAHFGHQARRWNPKMDKYLYAVKAGSHVFDLTQTKELLEETLDFLTKSAKEGKNILILGTKKQVKDYVSEVAGKNGVHYVNERWLGGTITNFSQIKVSIQKLADMKKKREAGEYKIRTKKERILIDREIERLERFFSGISTMETTPDILVVIDTKREKAAVKEAQIKDITVVGIVDSNADPTDIDYPIPMNDDATKALEYVLGLMVEAIKKGTTGTKSTKKTTSTKSKTGTKGKKDTK